MNDASHKLFARLASASPISILRAATDAVPAVRYALGVLGIVAAVSLAGTLVTSFRVAVFGTLVTLVLMVTLVVFAAATKLVSGAIKLAAIILVYAFLSVAIASAFSLFSSVFFKWPVDLQFWITGHAQVNPTPSPTPQVSPSQMPTGSASANPANRKQGSSSTQVLSADQRARQLKQEAERLINSGKYQEAIAKLNQALEIRGISSEMESELKNLRIEAVTMASNKKSGP
jgi:hypothetical protein